jgi:streptomycin 6-kinase
MPASYSDMAFLAAETTFAGRVAASLWQQCVNIANEAWSNVHAARKAYVTQILNNPNFYKPLFVNIVSVDTTVIADATVAGTVVLSAANVAAQGALVTDVHIGNAISGAFNAFITGI